MPVPSGVTLFIECPCGFGGTEPLSQYDADGYLIVETDDLYVQCPDCEEFHTSSWGQIHHNGSGIWLKFDLEDPTDPGDLTDKENPFLKLLDEDYWADKDDSTEDSDASDQSETCSACGTELSPEELQSGPEHPEIGWEYYQCDECEGVTRHQ